MGRLTPATERAPSHRDGSGFLESVVRLTTVTLQNDAPRLQYAYLVLFKTGRAHLVRQFSRARVILQAIDTRANGRFGKHIVPLSLLNLVERVVSALKLYYFRLKARQIQLRLAQLGRESEELLRRVWRQFALVRGLSESVEPGNEVIDRPGDIAGHARQISDVHVHARAASRLSGSKYDADSTHGFAP